MLEGFDRELRITSAQNSGSWMCYVNVQCVCGFGRASGLELESNETLITWVFFV